MNIAEGLARVRAAIEDAAVRAGRDPAGVRLVAVSKRHPVAAICEAVAAGHRLFGENFAQELTAKAAELATLEPAPAVELHHIGHLQRNKVKAVVGAASLVHAVDSERLLDAIDKRARALGQVQPILLEVNVAGEASKGGVTAVEALALVERAAAATGVRLDGLMTMPPWALDGEANRRHFAALRALRDELARPEQPLPELSMGTTADFEVAVEEGATLVRVGTAIFGPRPAAV